MYLDSPLTWVRIITPPVILWLALNWPTLTYQNHATKATTIMLVFLSACDVLTSVKIMNPTVAFMIGLMEGWIMIWAIILLLRFNPTVKAGRRRWSRVPCVDGEYEHNGLIWQTYPQKDTVARLYWTFDLLIGFRAVGWRFHEAVVLTQAADQLRLSGPGTGSVANKPVRQRGVLHALGKLLRDASVFRGIAWMAMLLEERFTPFPWQVQAIHTLVWIATSVPFINLCHSGWDIVGRLVASKSSTDTFDILQYNPSPWGTTQAIVDHGIAGLWGVTWHNYFKFGFQCAADLLVPRTTDPKAKSLLRLTRICVSFLLSGFIHFCGSHMLPGDSQPTKELLFFMLQGLAVLFQISIYDKTVARRWRRIFNPLLVAVWLYWTGPLIFEDQRRGGMWR